MPTDEIVFPKHRRVFTSYSTDAAGITELHLYYGEKEILFDEPELFAFGEGLAKQSRFVARTATTWGEGYQDDRPMNVTALKSMGKHGRR